MKKRSLLAIIPAAILSFLLLLPLFGCGGTTEDGSEKLSTGVEKIIDSPEFKHSSWTLKVVDMDTGEVLEETGPDRMLDPASNAKLFTVATALEILGPDYRFETPVYEQGVVETGGRLNGNLILVASGDLAMGGRGSLEGQIQYTDMDHTDAEAFGTAVLTDGDPLAGLDYLAAQVAGRGIKAVNGEVIIDDRLFKTGRPLENAEADIISPVAVNDNLIDIAIKPTDPGEKAEVDWRPKTSYYVVDADVKTGAGGKEARVEITSPEPGRILVEGAVPSGEDEIVRVYQVENPPSLARTLFIEALERAGVDVKAHELEQNPTDLLPPSSEYENMQRVALLESPPFSEYAKLVLKVSLNRGANTLLPLIAVHEGKGTFEDGLKIERDFLEEAGVDVEGLVLNDGEGGPCLDYVCSESVVQLLRYMSTSDNFEAYKDALPVMCVDGSLARLLSPKSPIKGKVQAKTGTHMMPDLLNDRAVLTARALGGYMTTSSGRDLAFQVCVNIISPGGDRENKELLDKHASILEVIYKQY